MKKDILLDKSENEIKEILTSLGEKPFRAKQIIPELFLGKEFSEMTALPLSLREKLNENFIAQPTKIIKVLTSSDGTEKYLFALTDGNVIEGVLMKYKYGNTLCVSTQVGCRMGCAFCASTLGGLIRNLTAGEILGEVISANKQAGGNKEKRAVTNVVLMGSGEPLDNYDNTLSFIKKLSKIDGLNISPRNVSLSTSGLVPEMIKLSNENLPINLTVSLHSPFDEERSKIMPIAKKYKIEEILNACSLFFEKTKRRYIFEYVLIKGENDGERHIKRLYELLKNRPCHLNIIRLNAVKERSLQAVDDKNAYAFCEKLNALGISATVRRRMGDDIEGACGQLRRKFLGENV